jgi:hypothetical protein
MNTALSIINNKEVKGNMETTTTIKESKVNALAKFLECDEGKLPLIKMGGFPSEID